MSTAMIPSNEILVNDEDNIGCEEKIGEANETYDNHYPDYYPSLDNDILQNEE